MMNKQIRELIYQNKKLASSEHYWRRAVAVTRQRLEQYEPDNPWQARIERQLSYCEHRERQAVEAHNSIDQQLTALDPEGSKRRQRNSIESGISHLKADIKTEEARPLYPKRLERLKTRLSKLEARKAALSSSTEPPDRSRIDDQQLGKGEIAISPQNVA